MTQIDFADVVGRMMRDGWSLSRVEADSTEFTQIPEQWRPIALSADPEARRTAALALWNRAFLDLMPNFTKLFRTQLIDVRVYVSVAGSVLLYLAKGAGEEHLGWVGCDPRTFGAPPPFWDLLPQPARTFLRDVHAGFTAPDQESFGLMRPAQMQTIAARGRRPDGIPGWDDAAAEVTGRIASNRLLQVTKDDGNLLLCVSPDLPKGKVALVYEGDVDPPQDFGPAFDELMTSAFDEI